MNWKLGSRFTEPSTWVAIGSALGFGTDIDENTWSQIGAGVGAVCLVIGALVKDPGSET